MLASKTHRIIGHENRIRVGINDFLVRTTTGWQAEKRPFVRPIHHLRDARAAYKSQNK